MMDNQERYWELRKERNRTAKAWLANPDPNGDEYVEYREARAKFADFCREILEQLMEENPDILEKLKEGVDK